MIIDDSWIQKFPWLVKYKKPSKTKLLYFKALKKKWALIIPIMMDSFINY